MSRAPKSPRRAHPAHRVREIRSLGDDRLCGWSIKPEQVVPMQRAIARRVHLAMRLRGAEEELAHFLAPIISVVALRAIGLPGESVQSKIQNPKSKIR